MADETRPPVAIRSLRPYATEEAFLAEERDTLTRTAVTLIGAPSRPRGVVIRFELTLNDGTPLLRGEGRVLSFQPPDEHGPCSLTLRFTKLDAKSKALVDKAAALRDSVAPQPTDTNGIPPSPDTEPPPPDEGEDALASTSMGPTMPALLEDPSEELIALAISSGNLPLGEAEEVGVHVDIRTDAPPPPSTDGIPTPLPPRPPVQTAATPIETPTDASKRNGLLDRLRTRAKALSPLQVATILAVPRPTS